MKNYFKISVNATWTAVLAFIIVSLVSRGYWLPFWQISFTGLMVWVGMFACVFLTNYDESDGHAMWIPLFTTALVFMLMSLVLFINTDPNDFLTGDIPPSVEYNTYFFILLLGILTNIILIVRLIINLAVSRERWTAKPEGGGIKSWDAPLVKRQEVGDLFGYIFLQIFAQIIVFSGAYALVN